MKFYPAQYHLIHRIVFSIERNSVNFVSLLRPRDGGYRSIRLVFRCTVIYVHHLLNKYTRLQIVLVSCVSIFVPSMFTESKKFRFEQILWRFEYPMNMSNCGVLCVTENRNAFLCIYDFSIVQLLVSNVPLRLLKL